MDRPDQIAKPHLSTARKVREDYFGEGANNATAFFSIPIHVAGGTGPNQGRFGTLGRNTFRGPAFYNFDFALIKDTPFGRRKSGAELMDLQFRSEFFNLFNIVTMGCPSNILNGSGFGEISKTAGNSRQIQFSLKLDLLDDSAVARMRSARAGFCYCVLCYKGCGILAHLQRARTLMHP